MRLITINSNSSGNSYALVSSATGEILLLEAGIKMADVKKAIDYRLSDVVGCVCSHKHGDHSKYAVEYSRFGIKMYCNEDTICSKSFGYETCNNIESGKTYRIGKFSVAPFDVAHDVPCLGFLIQHSESGVLMFVTDTYKIPVNITGVDHYLIEANYSDTLLKQNVWDGRINKSQADRIMLSHMSLEYTVKYLSCCGAKSAKTVTLCHLSERNSDPVLFKSVVESALGVPCFIARKGLVVEINKDLI